MLCYYPMSDSSQLSDPFANSSNPTMKFTLISHSNWHVMSPDSFGNTPTQPAQNRPSQLSSSAEASPSFQISDVNQTSPGQPPQQFAPMEVTYAHNSNFKNEKFNFNYNNESPPGSTSHLFSSSQWPISEEQQIQEVLEMISTEEPQALPSAAIGNSIQTPSWLQNEMANIPASYQPPQQHQPQSHQQLPQPLPQYQSSQLPQQVQSRFPPVTQQPFPAQHVSNFHLDDKNSSISSSAQAISSNPKPATVAPFHSLQGIQKPTPVSSSSSSTASSLSRNPNSVQLFMALNRNYTMPDVFKHALAMNDSVIQPNTSNLLQTKWCQSLTAEPEEIKNLLERPGTGPCLT